MSENSQPSIILRRIQILMQINHSSENNFLVKQTLYFVMDLGAGLILSVDGLLIDLFLFADSRSYEYNDQLAFKAKNRSKIEER